MALPGHLTGNRRRGIPAKSGNEPFPETVAVPRRVVKSVWLTPPAGGLPSVYMEHGSKWGRVRRCGITGLWRKAARNVIQVVHGFPR